MPANAAAGAAGPELCWKMASRKKTDSSPSRATAKKTMAVSAQLWPEAEESATSMELCSSALMERAARRIQKTIHTRTTTATALTAPSNSSWSFCGKAALASCRPAPTKSDRARARNTPTQTAGSQAERPVWLR